MKQPVLDAGVHFWGGSERPNPDHFGVVFLGVQTLQAESAGGASVIQNATEREVYFPAGADWQSFFDPSAAAVKGGSKRMVHAPLDSIPVYWRKASAASGR